MLSSRLQAVTIAIFGSQADVKSTMPQDDLAWDIVERDFRFRTTASPWLHR